MTDDQLKGLSVVRTKMLVSSLLVAGFTGVAVFAAGAGTVAVVGAVVGSLLSAIICMLFLGQVIAWLRAEQSRVVECLRLTDDLSAIRSELDDIKAITRFNGLIIQTVENRRKERQQLLDQIVASQEQLKRIIHSRMTGDDKEVAQVHDAVKAIECMNNSFSALIAELEELSSRSEQRSSISVQMGASTDAIAENISQYSSFVIQTSSSIEEMTCAIRETADNIRGLSASTEQTAVSINQIRMSQANVHENAELSATASENVRDQAQQGLRSMADTLKAMQEIEKSNDETFDSINRLSRYSVRVGEFLNVIQEVVEQTNLLSLNASIIAAQAGERGRAFAVVAEEVRSLAHRTSSSTREIEDLVRNIQKETFAVQSSVTQGKEKVKEGVKISAMTNEALVEIERSAEGASSLGARIASEMSEQAVGIQRISEEAEKNLERVKQITLITEHQQAGTSLMVNNLEQMRDLAHRVNSSAQEQAKGNRLYLKSVMEDNERTRKMKEGALGQISVAAKAVDAVRRVESLVVANTAESRNIMEEVKTLTSLIDHYRGGAVVKLVDEAGRHD